MSAPQFIAPNFAGIPAELRKLPRWVTWRAVERRGKTKPDKVPYRADLPDAKASSTDPDTWCSFEQAEAAYLDGDRTGIGLVLDGTGDLAGVDIDGCRDAATGAVNPVATALLESMGAGYVEVSPSGTGLRAFGYAPPLDRGCAGSVDGLKLELYSAGRYLTLTGQPIKAEPLVPLRGFGDLADRIRGARKVNPATGKSEDAPADERYAELVRRIWSGEVFHDSLRDMAAAMVAAGMQPGAVVNHLRGLMDASSAPRDERWKARRAQIPELVNTAAAKFAPVAADFAELLEASKAKDAPRYHLLTPDELHSLPPLAWLIRNMFPRTGLVAIFGPSGSGKTFVGFDLAAAIGGGWRWFGLRVTQTPVIYAALEGEAGFRLRAQAWETHRGLKLPEGLRMMLQPFRLTEPQDVADLAAAILASVGAGAVVFIDTLNRAAPTADENSSRDMGGILEGAKQLQAATGGLVVLIHHTGKDAARGLRGHSSLFAAMDAAVEVTREGDRREWKVSKSKDGQDGASHPFALHVVDLGTDEHGDLVTSCVVTSGESNATRAPRVTPALRLALQTLVETGEQSGELSAAGVLRGVHVEDWRRVFYAASTADTLNAKKVSFHRARNALCSDELATVEADYYLPTDPALHVRIAETRRQALAAQHVTTAAHVPLSAVTTRHTTL